MDLKKKKKNLVHVGGGESLELFNVYRTSVWGVEKVLEVDSGGGYTTLWLWLMPLACTLKNGYSGKLYVYFATQKNLVRTSCLVYLYTSLNRDASFRCIAATKKNEEISQI